MQTTPRPSRSAFLVLILTAAVARAQTPPGACVLEDPLFATQEGGCKDLTTGAIWSAVGPNQFFEQAVDYCDNLVEGGFDDWRLPTIEELQTVCANGGYTHLNVFQANTVYWSNKIKGNWGWVLRMQNCEVLKIWWPGSIIHELCVRGGGSGGGHGHGHAPSGPGEKGKEDESDARPDRPSIVQQVGGGELSVTVRVPQQPGKAYVLMAGLADRHGVRMGPGVVLGSPGRLDGFGRAAFRVDLNAMGLPAATAARLSVAVLVLDPMAPTGVAAVLSTPGER